MLQRRNPDLTQEDIEKIFRRFDN
jgi:hypothetical protein